MLDILIFKLLPWAGLLSGASFALIVLMTAFWAGQEERSAGWAWCLFALFSSLPLLAVLALRLDAAFVATGVTVCAAGLMAYSRRYESRYGKNPMTSFLRPIKIFTPLFALYLFCALSVFVVAVMSLVWGQTWTPHFEIRRNLVWLGFLLPFFISGLVFWRESWSWGKRAIVGALMAGGSSTVCLVLAWNGNTELSILRSTISPSNEGLLTYHVQMGFADSSFGSHILKSTRTPSGVRFEKFGMDYDPSPSGNYRVRIIPSSSNTIGFNRRLLLDSGGREVADLGTCLFLDSLGKGVGWPESGPEVYAYVTDELVLEVWDGDKIRNLDRSARQFFWSPDGGGLTFQTAEYDQPSQIVSYQLDGEIEKILFSESDFHCEKPEHQDCRTSVSLGSQALSPDGRWLILSARHERPRTEMAVEREEGTEQDAYGKSGILLDLNQGHFKEIEGEAFVFWSPKSELLAVDEKAMSWLDPSTGSSRPAVLPIEPDYFDKRGQYYLLFDEKDCYFSKDLKTWSDFPSKTSAVVFSPDGTKACAIDDRASDGSRTQLIHVYDTRNKEHLGVYDLSSDLLPGFLQSHPLRMKFAPPNFRE